MNILTKHLMRFARYSEATSNIKLMPNGKAKFARALALSIISQKDCSLLPDWLIQVKKLETELKLLSYDEIRSIQAKAIKFIR